MPMYGAVSYFSSSSSSRSSSVDTSASQPLTQAYEQLVSDGTLEQDEKQRSVVAQLSRIQSKLADYSKAREVYSICKSERAHLELEQHNARERSRELSIAANAEYTPEPKILIDELEPEANRLSLPALPPPPRVPRGLYIHGDVGTGKTMLMDLFFNTMPGITSKRRVHLHAFMLEVHNRVHQWKKDRLRTHGRNLNVDRSPEGDAIIQVARAIAQESLLLAFDEFVVTDVADALIMRHLFTEILAQGTVIVATSNTSVTDLYANGLNREYFLPFVELLSKHCKTYHVVSTHDYRMAKAIHSATSQLDSNDPTFKTGSLPADALYISPLCTDTTERMEKAFASMAGSPLHQAVSCTLPVMFGRSLCVQHAASGVCWVSFEQMCGSLVASKALGNPDFQTLCEHFDTVFLTDVPKLGTRTNRNETRRFIWLIDKLYDHKVRLVMSAAEPAVELFDQALMRPDEHFTNVGPGERAGLIEMGLASRRVVSRLVEMASTDYVREWIDARSARDTY